MPANFLKMSVFIKGTLCLILTEMLLVLICDVAQGYHVPANVIRPLGCNVPANFLKIIVSIKGTLCTILTEMFCIDV